MEAAGAGPVICGTDFSRNAAQATSAAAAWAARSGRSLLLVHVADEFDALGRDQKKREMLLEAVGRKLRAEAERLRATGITVEERVLVGNLAERAMLELASSEPAALVVVAAVSKASFDRWTLGSVSESLAESLPSPTLVVRSATPFEAWASGERPLKVVVAADAGSASDAALRGVGDLGRIGPCAIVVAQVDQPQEEAERLGIDSPPGGLEQPAEVQGLLERDLGKRVRALLGGDGVRVVVEPLAGRPDARLIELATEEQADLLVVGTHQRRGFSRLLRGSVSRSVLRHAPMSVACVPTTAVRRAAAGQVDECRRVLVAVDPADRHGIVTPSAYSIVHRGGTVRLLHNVVPFREPTPQVHAQRVAEAKAKLGALAPGDAVARGVTTELEISESRDTAAAVCAAAERFDADVVCIGGHTRPSFAARVLGSVSLAVLQGCRRPVLLVWPPTE
jgi:nucleotide-binding universal stress UspA family protein